MKSVTSGSVSLSPEASKRCGLRCSRQRRPPCPGRMAVNRQTFGSTSASQGAFRTIGRRPSCMRAIYAPYRRALIFESGGLAPTRSGGTSETRPASGIMGQGRVSDGRSAMREALPPSSLKTRWPPTSAEDADHSAGVRIRQESQCRPRRQRGGYSALLHHETSSLLPSLRAAGNEKHKKRGAGGLLLRPRPEGMVSGCPVCPQAVCVAIHSSMRCSSTPSGMMPDSRPASWNARMSKREPRRRRASSRRRSHSR